MPPFLSTLSRRPGPGSHAPGLRVFRTQDRTVELRYNVRRGSLVLNRFRSGNADSRDAFTIDGRAASGGEAHVQSPTVRPLASIWFEG